MIQKLESIDPKLTYTKLGRDMHFFLEDHLWLQSNSVIQKKIKNN